MLNILRFMITDKYEYYVGEDYLSYEFTSEGNNGKILKVVQYSRLFIGSLQAYNIGFGDRITGSMKINDTVVSNNGDITKVLNTVASTIFDFSSYYLHPWIYAKGSTPIRTLLHQRKLDSQIDVIDSEFNIYGLSEGGWEKLKKGHKCFAFLFKKK